MNNYQKLFFYIVQVVGAFAILNTVVYLYPGEFFIQFLFSFFIMLFFTIALSGFLNKVLKVDVGAQKGHSWERNQVISRGYLWFGIILLLAGLGNVLEGNPNQLTIVGTPVILIWYAFTRWGISEEN